MSENQEENPEMGGGNVNIDATVANLALADVVEPVRTPSGDFDLQITGWKTGESSQKKTPFVQFALVIAGTRNIQDGQDLGDSFDPQELNGRELTYDFYLTTKALFMLKGFLTAVGFDDNGMSIGEMFSTRAFDGLIGAAVVGQIRPEHYKAKDGTPKIAHRLSDFVKA